MSSVVNDKKHMLAGSVAGAVSMAALYPLDLVKVRMQVYEGQGNRYSSVVSGISGIARQEGFTALYKGMAPGLIASTLSWGGYFFFYELSKARKSNGDSNVSLRTADHLLSGIEAGAMMVVLTNPLWLIKTRLQLQVNGEGSARHYSGFIDAVKTIVRDEGVLGLYRGFIPAMLLTTHGAVQFAVYEKTKVISQSLTGKKSSEQPPWVSMFLGGFSKIIAATVTYPYQVIKSRLQQRDNEIISHTKSELQSAKSESTSIQRQSKYSGVFDCVSKMWRNEGMRGFFKGIVPNVIKVAPASAITFVVYEEVLKLFK